MTDALRSSTSDLRPLNPGPDLARIKALVTDAVNSHHTRRAYSRALDDFFAWHQAHGRPPFNRAAVHRYVKFMANDLGLSASTINQRLSAIRALAREAADNGLLDRTLAEGVMRVKGRRAEGRRLGNWLSREEAQALLDAPDATTLAGLRDRALLAIAIGCGLRRAELARLRIDHVQLREGRWVIVDLLGKRAKTRSVPMPFWARVALDAWLAAAGIAAGHIFRPVNKAGALAGEALSPQAVYNITRKYTGGALAPHDLRRTFAQLAHKGGASLEQIQLSLGHASIQTTEVYLGVAQDLHDAPADHIHLEVKEP